MDLDLSDEQQQLVDAFAALYAKESPTERVRAAEPVGHDPELWLRLQELGAVEMAVDESAGGWGASLLDLALVAEQHGRYLGAAPLIEAQAAARLLARLGSHAAASNTAASNTAASNRAAKGLLESAVAGTRLVTLALHPPRRGVLSLLPAGAVADDVIFFDGGSVWHASLAGDDADNDAVGRDAVGRDAVGSDATARGRTAVSNLGSLPLADVAVPAHVTELASGGAAAATFDEAVNEWVILMANALIGLASRSIEIGVEYVKERKAFGVPIGSFQAIAHGMADAAVARDGGTLLAREAAWSAAPDAQPERTLQLGPLAFGFCAEAAQDASYRSLHYHGGYGFMVEYDIQLYFRRARAWSGQYAEPDVAFALAAERRLAAAAAAAAAANTDADTDTDTDTDTGSGA
jgi:alkylation response protein AidB-like acyl-CoA dehydrogenase